MEPVDVKKLRAALKASYKALEPFRKHRLLLVKEFVGAHYSDDGSKRSVPVNHLSQAIQIHARNLYAKNPKATIDTPVPELQPMAKTWEVAVDKLLDTIDLETQGQYYVNAGLMAPLAIMNVGLNQVGEIDVDGQMFPIGRPFAKVVDLDDWVHDTSAKTWDECAFMGKRIRLPLDWAKSCPLFVPEVAVNLTPTERYRTAQDGGSERVSTIGTDQNMCVDEFKEYTEVWELYLPFENKVITLSCDESQDVALREVEYDGYKGGPYHKLNYIDVPNNVCGVPPAANWVDLHDAMNSTMRKLIRQVKREKHVVLFKDAEDAKRYTNSSDGDGILWQSGMKPEEVKTGGPDMASAQFSQMLQAEASRNAGNLDSMGGLGAQTDTLGQDQLIAASTSRQLQEMQARTAKALREIVRHLAWLQWVDNMQDITVSQEVLPGFQVQETITPEQRAEADFMLFNVDIVPYSMEEKTPAQKLQIAQGLSSTALPMLAPMLQMQGKAVDADQLWNKLCDMAGVPELKDIVIDAQTPPAEPPATAQQPPAVKAPVTTRNYTRQNVGGNTREARGAQMKNTMSMMAKQAEPANV